MEVLLERSDVRLSPRGDLANSTAEEFADLVGPYLAKMGRVAARLGEAADVDDVVQESLIRAWTNRKRFDPERGAFSAWLMAITADRARKMRRRSAVYAKEGAAPDSQEARMDVEFAVAALSARQRLVIDCYYFVGLSVVETAAVMKCSAGTVKSTLSDARKDLRIKLGGQS